MFLKKIIETVPTEIEKMLLEQQETLRKLNIISEEVQKIKNNPSHEVIKNMYDASNTLKNPIIDISQNPLILKAERFFDLMDKIGNVVMHPIIIANAVAGASYWICLVIGIGGILFYVIGYKKGVKYTAGSLLSYTLIQACNYGLNLL